MAIRFISMRFTGLFIGVRLTAKFPEIPMIFSKDLKLQREREKCQIIEDSGLIELKLQDII